MQRKLLLILLVIIITAMTAIPMFAHGGHGKKQTLKYSVCDIENCTQTALHIHNGDKYIGHYYGDGHDYHDYCDVKNCTEKNYHEHNNSYCFGRNNHAKKNHH